MAFYAGDDAMIKKAADLLRLSVRLPEYADKYKAFTAGNPGLASAATQYIASVNGMVTKGTSSSYCVACGHTIKSRHPRCRHCGERNKAYITGSKERPVMGKKKAAKKALRDAKRRAYKSASGIATTSRGKAINKMMSDLQFSASPADRAVFDAWKNG